MKKKVATAVALSMLLSSLTPAVSMAGTTAAQPSYQQQSAVVSQAVSPRAEQAGQKLNQLKLMLGYPDGSLGLERNITRAEFTVLLMRMLGYQEIDVQDAYFTDIGNHWAKNMIALARMQGIVAGYPDKTFKPDQPISRVEAQAMLLRVLGYSNAMKGTWPYNVLVKAAEIGLAKDVMGSYNGSASRGDVAVYIDNALEIPLMEAVGYDSNGNVRYEVKEGKTLIKDKLGFEKVEGTVTNISQSDNKITVGSKTYTLKNGTNAEKWLGVEVEGYAKNGKIYYLKGKDSAAKIVYSMIDKVANGKITLKADGKEYALDANAVIYIDGSRETDRNKIIAGQYGRIVISGDKVTVVDLVNFDKSGLIVKSVDNEYVKYCDVSAVVNKIVLDNYDQVNVYKDGMKVALSDIKEGDILYVAEYGKTLNLYVMSKQLVTGKLTRVYNDKIEVGNKMIEFGDKVTYSKDGNKTIAVYNTVSDLDELFNQNVTVYLDINGKVRHIVADKVVSSRNVGIVIKKWLSDEQYVKVFNAQNGNFETYIYTEDTNKNITGGAKFDALNTKQDSTVGYDIVEFKADGNKLTEIAALAPVAEKPVTQIGEDYITTDQRYYVTSDTVVIRDAADANDLEVLEWNSICDTDDLTGVKAVVIPDGSTNEAKAIIFTQGIKKLGNRETFGVVVDKFLNSNGKGLEVSTAGGVKEMLLEDEAVYNSVYVGDVVSYGVDKDNEMIEVSKQTPVQAKIADVRNGSYIQFEGSNNYYKFADKAMVYDLTDCNLSNLDSKDITDNLVDESALDKGQTVRYILNSENEVVCVFIIAD